MSLVMAVISNEYVLLSGDRRLTSENKILDEETRKITVLNKNSILGYAGEGKACSKIISYLQFLNLNDYSIKELHNLISKKAKEVYLLNKEKFNIIIAGNNNGKLEVYIISTCDGFNDLNVIMPSNNKTSFVAFESGKSKNDASKLFSDLWECGVPDKQIAINILFNIHDCIAEDDYTVNMNLDFLYIDNNGNLDYKVARKPL
ncbi:hypothetical protein [Clostridium perfringens]|uniref:hypothetical protein n=1 Tax=Clostridium perfringens TaxID=1502 RepID=UPI0030D103F3